jgi:hypothetical protein
MKTILIFIAVLAFSIFGKEQFVFAQARDAGRLVVPVGWENKDSIRFGAWGPVLNGNEVSPFLDTLGVNIEMGFDNRSPEGVPGSQRVGVSSQWYGGWDTAVLHGSGMLIAEWCKERIFYPSRDQISPFSVWRYNDVNLGHGTWHDNRYDSCDISPYAEYPLDPSIVIDTFRTDRFVGAPNSLVRYGNEGRVILGYSDMRNANNLLTLMGEQFFNNISYTPTVTNAILEFNIDTDSIRLDSTNLTADDVPLLRVQILFKEGNKIPTAVLPFVPFKTASATTNAGWWKIVDTVITKTLYNSLDSSYRTEDSVGGNLSHSWKFKQLHLTLRPPPNMQMDTLLKLQLNGNLRNSYGGSTDNYHNVISSQHSDYLVGQDTQSTTKNLPLLEMRVLSTYRSTVRIRSLSYHDDLADKFLYRKRVTADSTHGLDSDGVHFSALDDSLMVNVNRYASLVPNGLQREIEFTDYPDDWNHLSLSGVGLLDYYLAKRKMNTHIHEQFSDFILEFRRSRLSQNGVPPSMFENEAGGFTAGRGGFNNNDTNAVPTSLFPLDYVYNGLPEDNTHLWPLSANDSMTGQMFIIRPGPSKYNPTDSLYAYHRYTDLTGGLGFLRYAYRFSNEYALNHPKNKRFAIEASPQGWGLFHTLAFYVDSINAFYFPKIGTFHRKGRYNGDDSVAEKPDAKQYFAYYEQRPTTPEETTALIYGALANGISCFSDAQVYEAGNQGGGCSGLLGFVTRTTGDPPSNVNNHFNFGHRRSGWGTNAWSRPDLNECDSPLPEYYLGYANHYRAFLHAFNRINSIYDTTDSRTNKIPFKRFSWMNAYSSHIGLTGDTTTHPLNTDSVTLSGSFLKCFCTTSVKRWSRGTHNEYIDSIAGGGTDPAQKTFVEVGLFKDSIDATHKNYAALIVNTRLYPSLRDAEDSIYYNQGLDSAKDRCKSTLGDIDTRKVWFHIDTNKFDQSFRVPYYVIKDLWHPDSLWLVKNDSDFAIYLKPGDAKFLYIEKGVAITMAKSAATEEPEYAFNNGRRVAEILDSSWTVGTYVRGGKLYVSYPRKGRTIEGYNEHSGGDNIATGHEVLLDSVGTNARPSISAGMDDKAVAIVYWNSLDSGRIKAAYQKHPDSAWMFTRYTGHAFVDTTGSDHSEVTPVITPYADGSSYRYVPGSDTIWWIAAAYQGSTGNNADPQGIAALRLRIFKDSIRFINDAPMQYFYKNLINNPSRDASCFPTIASRPINNLSFPVRFAWQNYGKILYNKYRNSTGTVTPALGQPFVLSDGLSSLCYNRHPSIAMHLLRYPDALIKTDTVRGCGCCCTPPPEEHKTTIQAIVPGTDRTLKEYDEVAWESKLYANKKWITNQHYWPVLRQGIEYLGFTAQQTWTGFRVFKPFIDSEYFHYPIVSASSRSDTNFGNQNKLRKKSVYFDDIRLAWQDKPDEFLDFAHYVYTWKRSVLGELGTHPSLPQSTFDILWMTDSSIVPSSVGFVGLQIDTGGKNHVRVTNGWFPKVSYPLDVHIYTSLFFGIPKIPALMDCLAIKGKEDYGGIIVQNTGGGSARSVEWLSYSPQPTDPMRTISIPWDTLATPSQGIVAFYSDTLIIHANDSIVINRRMDTINVTNIRAAFSGPTDYLMRRITLRRYQDSSIIGTIDSMMITSSVARYPGSVLDTHYAKYKYPNGAPTDSAFILVEVRRGDINDSLAWAATEIFNDTAVPIQSFKTIAEQQPPPIVEVKPPYLFVDVVPNPFNQTTKVKIKSAEGKPTRVEVFDLLGKKIGDLFNAEFPSSAIEVNFEAAALSAGSYLVRVQSGNAVETRKVELIK